MFSIKRIIRYALIGSLALGFCADTSVFASSFNIDWKAAINTPIPNNSITGPWQGVWRSEMHHVGGPLRCVIKDLGHGNYEAFFHAQFHFFHFSYLAKLAAEKTAGGTLLKGDANLGWMGGVYHYMGEVSSQKYVSSYKSPSESGRLELSRPKVS